MAAAKSGMAAANGAARHAFARLLLRVHPAMPPSPPPPIKLEPVLPVCVCTGSAGPLDFNLPPETALGLAILGSEGCVIKLKYFKLISQTPSPNLF